MTTRSKPHSIELRRRVEDFHSANGLRSTQPRRVIIDCVFNATGHITVDATLQKARAVDSKIGYATVYRTLRMLCEAGVLHEHRFKNSQTSYELGTEESHHDHMICLGCEKVVEFTESVIEELQRRIAEQHHFVMLDHKLELYGFCPTCQETRSHTL